MNRQLRFLSPVTLRPHEETVASRLGEVIELLLREQAWTRPICIEEESLCVMDGHHRRLAAIHLGLTKVPVVAFRYFEVRLGTWKPGLQHEPGEVIDRARLGRLLPPKTTRHLFPPFEAQAVPLLRLIGGASSSSKRVAAQSG